MQLSDELLIMKIEENTRVGSSLCNGVAIVIVLLGLILWRVW